MQWFEDDRLKIHLGVDPHFVAARKAQVALIVEDLQALTTKLAQAVYRIVEDRPLYGYERKYIDDPFGIRIELMEPIRLANGYIDPQD